MARSPIHPPVAPMPDVAAVAVHRAYAGINRNVISTRPAAGGRTACLAGLNHQCKTAFLQTPVWQGFKAPSA